MRKSNMKFYAWSLGFGFGVDKGRRCGCVLWCSNGYLFSTLNTVEMSGGVTQKRDFDLSSLGAFPWIRVCEEKCQFLCR